MTEEESEVTESVYEDMSRKAGFPPNPRRSRRRKRLTRERPKTATLPHPNILDETLKDKVDMTLTKKDLLAAVKLCNDRSGAHHATNPTRTASNLARLRKLRQYNSADETGSSSGSAEQIYCPPRTRKQIKTKTGARPLTSRLEGPSQTELEVPNIRYYSKPKSLKARLSQRLKPEARIKLLSKPTDQPVEPCLSCGRTDQPERFHTHPSREKEKNTHKSPLKENKQNTKEEKPKTEPSPEHLKEKQTPNNRRQRHSQSPKKSQSPEKSLSPIETSETQSPQVKRRQKNSNNNEKENVGSRVADNSKRSQKTRVSKPKTEGETRKENKREFTVDIFTAKTSEEKEREKSENSESVQEADEKKVGGESDQSGEEVEVSTVSSRPTVKCNTCGKEFGKSSIKFHEPQCKKKKMAETLRKEKEKSDSDEKEVSHIDIIEEENLNDSFNAIWEAHVQQLIPCTQCGRTFFPDRIEVHQRSCKGIARPPKTADSQLGRPEFIRITQDNLKQGNSSTPEQSFQNL